MFRNGVKAVAGLLVAAAMMAPGTASAAAPANDMIADAQTVGPALPVSVQGTTIGATAEPGEYIYSTGNPGRPSVWYRWTAPATGTVKLDLCGGTPPYGPDNSYIYGVAAYTGGSTWSSLTEVTSMAGPCKTDLNAVAGTTYKIQVAFADGEEHNFTLSIHVPHPPVNDDFSSPETIPPDLPATVTGSTIEATAETGEPATLGGNDARTVWYSWTAPDSGQILIDICDLKVEPGSTGNQAFGIYTGSSLANLDAVAETEGIGTQCRLLATVTQGTTYRIGVGAVFGGEYDFTLRMRSAAPPGNDDFADASVIGSHLPTGTAGNNRFATAEPGEPDIGGFPGDQSAHSVWYRWTSRVTGRVVVSACSDNQTRVGIYTGSTLAGLTDAGEAPGYTPYCRLSLDAVSGTHYVIAVTSDSWGDAGGPFRLALHRFSPPPNDNFIDAQRIGPGLPVREAGNNADAGTEPGEPPMPWYMGAPPRATVWYRWKSTAGGPVEVSACGSDVIPIIYTGAGLATLTPVAPLDYDAFSSCATGPGSKVDFTAIRKTTYRIKVDELDRDLGGPFTLRVVNPNARTNLHRRLKRAIGKCRKRYRIRGSARHRAKMRRRRAACFRHARRKIAIKRCRRITSPGKRRMCIKRARKRYGARHGHGAVLPERGIRRCAPRNGGEPAS